jgi:hypothetical protein
MRVLYTIGVKLNVTEFEQECGTGTDERHFGPLQPRN